MKYNGLSVLKNEYTNPIAQFFRQFLRSNIKMPYFNSSKRINFSERQFNGEKFLMENKSFFPYEYKVFEESKLNEPLNIGIFLENNLSELELCKSNQFYKDKFGKKVEESIVQNITSLDKLMKYQTKLDFPVSTFAVYCFSRAILREKGIAVNVIKDETFNKALDHFFEKINYADGTYISYIMCALVKNNIWDNSKWNLIFNRLKEVKFEFEFTKVNSINPHLFQYREVKENRNINDPMKFYGDAYYVLGSIKEAVKNNVNGSKEALEEFSKRVKA